MFTGIIETVGTVVDLKKAKGNLEITVQSSISSQLKIDQSISHNGVCLTVVNIKNGKHKVLAVDETLKKTNFGFLKKGDKINLERAMLANGRFDGHIVQGHIDCVAEIIEIIKLKGSFLFNFQFAIRSSQFKNLLIEKGSVCVNGVSLTAFDVKKNKFSVILIPYTFQNTTFQFLKKGDKVNIEFDVIGKFVKKILNRK